MKCDELERKLADFLADELSSADTQNIHHHLDECQRCAQRVRGMQQSAAALRSSAISEAAARSHAAAPASAQRRGASATPAVSVARPVPALSVARPVRAFSAILRYAAVVGISFLAGFAAREWRGAGSDPGMRGAAQVRAGDSLASASGETSALAEQFARVSAKNPDASMFSRGLLALARK